MRTKVKSEEAPLEHTCQTRLTFLDVKFTRGFFLKASLVVSIVAANIVVKDKTTHANNTACTLTEAVSTLTRPLQMGQTYRHLSNKAAVMLFFSHSVLSSLPGPDVSGWPT